MADNTSQNSSTPSAGADVDIYGDDSITFGLPEEVKTMAEGFAVTELNDDSEPQFNATAEGQDASVAALAVAKKLKFSGTGSGFILDAAEWKALKYFEFESNTYVILKKGRAFKFNEFLKANFSYVGYEGVGAN